MSMNENSYKSGHPVLGIVLGIIGVVAALLLTYLAGIVGGIIAGVFGLAALLIGISARKSGRGMGAIVTGALAIILAIVMTVSAVNIFKNLQQKAADSGVAPLMTKYMDKPELGFIGIIMNLPQDEGSLNDLTNELDQLNKLAEPAAN